MITDEIAHLTLLRKRGELDAAAALAQKLLQQPSTDVGIAIETLRQFGLILRGQNRYRQALDIYEVALELCTDATPSKTITLLHIHCAVALIRLTRYNDAASAIGLARIYWRQLDLATQFLLVSTEARLYRTTGDTTRAHQCSMIARTLADAAGDNASLARAHVDLARSYASVGATEEALEESFSAVRTADPEQHASILIEAYTTIYVAYHTLRRYPDALVYAQRAHDVAKTFGTKLDVVNTGYNVALAMADVHELPHAFTLLRGLHRQVKGLAIPTAEADYYHTLGQLHLHDGDPHTVIKVMRRCLDLNQQHHSIHEYRSAQFIIAQAYRSLGELERAASTADEIMQHYDQPGQRYDSLLASVLEFLASLEYERHRYREAYDHLHQLTMLRARSNSEMARRLASVLDIRYRVDQLQQHARRIEAENVDMRAQLASAALRLVQHASTHRRVASVINAEWRLFQMQFDRVHVGFIRQLSTAHASLSAAELRVCTMLVASFSTKDIAAVLSCSSRTVEWHRANIRRKLKLRPSANLTTYLTRFTT